MSGKYFKITYHPTNLGRFEERHDGVFVGFVDKIPHYAKPVDREQEAETRRLQREENDYDRYASRTNDPQFEIILEKMREKAAGLEPAEFERLNTDHGVFARAYDSVRRDGLEERHRARLTEIRERQHSSNAMERERADIAAIEEHERHARAVAAVEAANYEALKEEEPEGEDE